MWGGVSNERAGLQFLEHNGLPHSIKAAEFLSQLINQFRIFQEEPA
jgi:hypothetical protein